MLFTGLSVSLSLSFPPTYIILCTQRQETSCLIVGVCSKKTWLAQFPKQNDIYKINNYIKKDAGWEFKWTRFYFILFFLTYWSSNASAFGMVEKATSIELSSASFNAAFLNI